MRTDAAFKNDLRELLDSQRLAVLATRTEGSPHGSLVSFAAAPDMKEILFATTRSTRKYGNLARDPQVTLVIDNRENAARDIHRAMALTVKGRAKEVPPEDLQDCLAVYLRKHPYLKGFVSSPTCALVRVRVDSYSLVRRFQEVTELSLEGSG